MSKKLLRILTVLFVLVITASLIAVMVYITKEPQNNSTVSGTNGQSMNTSQNVVSDHSGGSTSSTDTSSTNSSESQKQDSVVSFLACPDNIIHPSVYADAIIRAAAKKGTVPVFSPLETADYDFSPIYENVAAAITAADIAYINNESLIGGNENGISGYPTFNTPEAEGEELCKIGFDVFNVAHNHMLDSGNDKYLKNCYNFYTEKGKTVIGYYKNEAAVADFPIIEKNGIKIAFLTYTSATNGITLPSGSETYIPYFNESLIQQQVTLAKQKSDIIIVSCHWGADDTTTVDNYQKTYAQFLISLNVDVIVGMGPHALQPMSWEARSDGGKTLLVYSLGNFFSGSQDDFNLLGGMLGFDIVKDGASGKTQIENVVLNPVITHYTLPGGVKISHDTGNRNYKIYFLKDYTAELASTHGAVSYDRTHHTTLIGGGFNIENLTKTVKYFIPAEFLPDYLKS